MKLLSIMRLIAIIAAALAAAYWGLMAIGHYPIIVIADSDLGAGAMEHVHDALFLFAVAVGTILFASQLFPLSLLRIALLLASLSILALWQFQSSNTLHSARWPLMAIICLAIAAEPIESRAIGNRPMALRLQLAMTLLFPCAIITLDWQARIYCGLIPSRTLPRQLQQPGLRTSLGLMDFDSASHAQSSASHLQAIGSKDGVLKIHTTMPQSAELIIPASGPDRMLQVLTFSPDGKVLAVADNDRMYVGSVITLWDVTPGSTPKATLRHRLAGPKHWFFSLDFFPDGRTLISASGDNTIRLWDAATGSESAQFIGHHSRNQPWDETADCVAAAPDGQTFATWAYDELKIWNRAPLKLLRTMDTRGQIGCSLTFTPDSQHLFATDRMATTAWSLHPSPAPTILLAAIAFALLSGIVWITQ